MDQLLTLAVEHAAQLIEFAAGVLATGIVWLASKNVFAKKLADKTAKKVDEKIDD